MTTNELFKKAAIERKYCKIITWKNETRIVEPYMIYKTPKGNTAYHCYQIGGYSNSGKMDWKNIYISDVKAIEIIEDKPNFRKRAEYNPENKKMFPEIFFKI